jgi:DNA repair/transcription protein MET18/MMS19
VTLTRFFISSLDDFDSLPPSLQALLVLSKLPTFDDDAAVEVYRALCEQVNMKGYTQVVRNMVYQLFDSFLAHHRNGESLLSGCDPS